VVELKQLQELGLTESEAEVYLALLQEGPVSAGIISKRTNLNRTSTYQILDRLATKGLLGYVYKGKRRIFQATAPEKFLAVQEEKVRLAKAILPELQTLAKHMEEEAALYRGRQGIRTIMNEILNFKEYVSFGSGGQFYDVMVHDFLLFQKEKRKRRIKSRVIIGKSQKVRPIVTEAHAVFRFVDDKFMTPTTTWVYGDNVAIIIWSATPVATHIRSKDVANAYRAYFELLWQNAEK